MAKSLPNYSQPGLSLVVRPLLAAVALALASPHSKGQTRPAQAAVYVQSSGQDSIGQQLGYEVRETIRRSAGLVLADRSGDARLLLRLTTLDPDAANPPSVMTVYAAVFTVRTFHETPVEMYLTTVVGTCGTNRLEICARRLTAELDEQALDVRRQLRNALDSPATKR